MADSDASPVKVASLTLNAGKGLVFEIQKAALSFAHTQEGTESQDDIQTLTWESLPSSGYYRIIIGGESTKKLNWSATTAQIQAALNEMESLDDNEIVVTGTKPTHIFTTTNQGMPDFDIDAGTLQIDKLIWVPTRKQVDYYEALGTMSIAYSSGTLGWSQVIELKTGITSGTMVLRFKNQNSSGINWNATAAQVKTALAGWTSTAATNYDVFGGPLPAKSILIQFKNELQFNSSPITVATHSFGSTNNPTVYQTGKQLFVQRQSSSGKYLIVRTPFL